MKNKLRIILSKLCLFFLLTHNVSQAETLESMAREKAFSQKINEHIQFLNQSRDIATIGQMFSNLKKDTAQNLNFIREQNILSPKQYAQLERQMDQKLLFYSEVTDLNIFIDLQILELEKVQSAAGGAISSLSKSALSILFNRAGYFNPVLYISFIAIFPFYFASDLIILVPTIIYQLAV